MGINIIIWLQKFNNLKKKYGFYMAEIQESVNFNYNDSRNVHDISIEYTKVPIIDSNYTIASINEISDKSEK